MQLIENEGEVHFTQLHGLLGGGKRIEPRIKYVLRKNKLYWPIYMTCAAARVDDLVFNKTDLQ